MFTTPSTFSFSRLYTGVDDARGHKKISRISRNEGILCGTSPKLFWTIPTSPMPHCIALPGFFSNKKRRKIIKKINIAISL
jgi:hypothetical protein